MSDERTLYHAMVDDNARCKTCNNKVVLLSPKKLVVPLGNGFYICFRCMSIGQIGVADIPIRGITALRREIRS